MFAAVTVVVSAVAGCAPKGASGDAGVGPRTAVAAAPRAFEALERVPPAWPDGGGTEDPMYRVAPFVPAGAPPPEGAVRVELRGEVAVSDAGVEFDPARAGWRPTPRTSDSGAQTRVLLVPDADTMLVQAAESLARLDDAEGLLIWLKHPDFDLAYEVELRDEPAFRQWLDESVPGKVRVIHRADGFEVQTNMGKLPGADRNGPTVPVRGGRMDLATLQKGLSRVRSRFSEAPDYCLVPSFGTAMADVARALAANTRSTGEKVFGRACLVYPRPPARDAGVPVP